MNDFSKDWKDSLSSFFDSEYENPLNEYMTKNETKIKSEMAKRYAVIIDENGRETEIKQSEPVDGDLLWQSLVDLASQKITPIDTLKGAMDNEKPTKKD